MLGGFLIGYEAVDQVAAQRARYAGELAAPLGGGDDQRGLARRDRGRGDALVGDPLDQLALVVERPADDFAGGARASKRGEFRRRDEAIDIERRVLAEIADTDEGDVGARGERQRRL